MNPPSRPTFLLFALDSPFSRPVLQALLDVGQYPAALILPNPDRTAPPRLLSLHLPDASPVHHSPFIIHNSQFSSLTETASQHGIPLLTLGNLRHPDALAALRNYHTDFLLTACFPRLLPPEILAIPKLGSLNLHPSLLPAYRGPEPLFWQFYFGEMRTGVTLHFMDEHADTGDIVFQAQVPFPDGISLAQAETLTAQAGGELILRALSDPEHLPRVQQSAHEASYHPRPTTDNLIIPTTWTARRAFNFLRAAREWGPFEIVDPASGQRLRVREAVALDEGWGAVPPRETGEGDVRVQFCDGAVQVRCT